MIEALLIAILLVLIYIASKLKEIKGHTHWILHWIERYLKVGDFKE